MSIPQTKLSTAAVMALVTCFTLSVILVTVFCLYCKKKYSYWSKKGVNGPVPFPIVGNLGNVMLQKQSLNQRIEDIYIKYKGEKLVGLYSGFTPVILVRDPELIKYVLIKEFDIFQERGISTSGSRLNDNLFSANGEKWKIMRKTLTPVFTTRKLKEMVPHIQKCIVRFSQYVNDIIEKNIDHEIRALTAKYTLDVIGSCAFGLDLRTFSDEENEFSVMAKKIFTPNFRARILALLDMIIPGIRKTLSTRPELQEFFVDLVRKVQKEREGSPLSHKDFMDLMIEIKEEGKISRQLKDGVSEIEIDDYMVAAQALVFYSAGFETSSATMSFLIHELALHRDIQDRVYKEICEVVEKYDGEINYDSVNDMKYLEMVFEETLRKYSIGSVLFRKSCSTYTFPGTDVTIPKGTKIMISASGLATDPMYFNNPNEFNPDNFAPEKLHSLPQCVYMPFGEGPRNCIGMRFAKVQSLLGTAAFLKQFKVEPTEKTKQVLVMDPKAIVLACKEGIWVKISKR